MVRGRRRNQFITPTLSSPSRGRVREGVGYRVSGLLFSPEWRLFTSSSNLFLHLFPFNVRCWTFDVRCSSFNLYNHKTTCRYGIFFLNITNFLFANFFIELILYVRREKCQSMNLSAKSVKMSLNSWVFTAMTAIIPLVLHVVVNRPRDFYPHFRLYLPVPTYLPVLPAEVFPEHLLSGRVLLCDSALKSNIAWKIGLILTMKWK